MQFLATFLLLITSTVAWRPTDRPCAGHRSRLCFLSFFWCSGSDPNACYYPEDVYPARENRGHTPALIWGKDYEISWTTSDSGPVTVWWVVGNYKQDAEQQPERENLNTGVIWEHNVTDGKLGFTFTPRTSMFPNYMAPNLSAEDASGVMIEHSYLYIQQFPRNSTGQITSALHKDATDRFYVYPPNTVDYIDYAVKQEDKRWRKKFSLGVGLGVGISVFIATLSTWFLAHWWTKRSMERRAVKTPVKA